MAQTMFGDVFSARQTGMEDLEKSATTQATSSYTPDPYWG